MADNLLSTLLQKLGMQVPEAGPAPTSEQRKLYEEMAQREQAKRGLIAQAMGGVLAGAPQFAKGFTVSDPNMPLGDLQKTSPWEKAGMFAAAAPIFPQKGIKGLFNRVERIAESLPEKVSAGKLASILKGNASKEEIGWRGLDKVIADPAKQIAKQDVVSTLQKNPLDVRIMEKRINTPEAYRKYGSHSTSDTTYDNYVMPGAKNYRETLIQLEPAPKKQPYTDTTTALEHDYPATAYTSHHWPDDPNTLVHVRHNERYLPHEEGAKMPSWNWSDATAKSFADVGIPVVGPRGRMLENIQSDWHQRGAHGGYFGEEGRDIHNQSGNPELQATITQLDEDIRTKSQEILNFLQDSPHGPLELQPDLNGLNDIASQINGRLRWEIENTDIATTGDRNIQLAKLQREMNTLRNTQITAEDALMRNANEMVPNAPFKDNWAELALKQQLLDVADRPDLDWLGIAPSSELKARGEDISPAFQDVQLPKTLEKLLGPYGGKVEKADLGIKPTHISDPMSILPENINPRGSASGELGPKGGLLQPETDTALLSFLGPQNVNTINDLKNQIINQRPNIQAFIARLSPEMKQKIKEKGFPMLMALLAQRQLSQTEQP